jgi:hypothetical protein
MPQMLQPGAVLITALVTAHAAGPVSLPHDEVQSMQTAPRQRKAAMVRRGRPPKFGRPAKSVALTLPHDVIDALARIDTDLGRAIVALVDQRAVAARDGTRELVDLVQVTPSSSLIVVDRRTFDHVPGCALLPLSEERAFLALEPGADMRALELAVMDRLEEETVDRRERKALTALRRALRTWRQDLTLDVNNRSIVLIERKGRRKRSARSA